MKHKFKIGDKVIYDGLVATVEGLTETAIGALPMLELVSTEDSEMTCTAMEDECESYNEDELIDQEERLRIARRESYLIARKVDGITDKYYRDGNH